MRQLTSRHTARSATRPTDGQRTVCVVDPRSDSYLTWSSTAAAHGLHVEFLNSAEAALRHAQSARTDLWVVNTTLPGLSGCDLCGMLRGQSPDVPVFLVADEYSTAIEHAAWRARATAFLCQPAQHDALARWLEHTVGVPAHGAQLAPITV